MQRINLYTAEFRPRRQYLSLPNVAVAAVIALLLGVLIFAGQWWHGTHLRSELAELQTNVTTARSELENAKVKLAVHVPSSELAAQLTQRSEEVAAKDELLAALKNTPQLTRKGYSPVLASLTRHPLAGLWLTHVDIVGDEVNLSGLTRKAELVPDYVDTLVKDADFGAQSYEVLAMQATDDGLLKFDLRDHADKRGAQ
jgi:Tfp pilus assembly protein PilN